MASLFDLTNEALRRWVTATGVDPDADSWSSGSWTVRGINDRIRVAQDADPTGLTTYLYLRACARDYVAGHSHDALALIERPAEVQEELAPLRALIEALDHPELVEWASNFQRQLRDMAEDQGVLKQTASTIDDLSALGGIRLDALHGARTLRRDTFARGPRRSDALRYNRRVLKFWNVNSLVRALEVQPEDGISLCLLRDPQVVEYSFFAFAMRDGDTLSMWSDVPESSHPLQKFMSRSRARARNLDDRACAFRFPYHLLDATFVDEGRAVVDDASGTALVRTNVEAVTIASLEDLQPDEILWALMMFDVLRYQPEHEGELSCTGERVYLALTGTTQLALGSVEPLTRADVTSAAIDQQLAESDGRTFKSTHFNAWMEERYADRVDEGVYNLFGTQQEGIARSATSDLVVQVDSDSESGRSLATTDPMSFGTATQMREDRLWIARHNQAIRIQELADAEFERRKEKIEGWFDEHVRKNSEWFIEAACRGTAGRIPVMCDRPGRSFDSEQAEQQVEPIKWQRLLKGDYALSIWDTATYGHVRLYTPHERTRDGRWVGRKWKEWSYLPPRCFVSGEAASVWTLFSPRSPSMLRAFVGGAKLPDVLEHWFPEVPYHGNSILARTDPLDSGVKNPWLKLGFHVVLGLSLREFRRQCKARGTKHPEDFATREDGHWVGWRRGKPKEAEEEPDAG